MYLSICDTDLHAKTREKDEDSSMLMIYPKFFVCTHWSEDRTGKYQRGKHYDSIHNFGQGPWEKAQIKRKSNEWN